MALNPDQLADFNALHPGATGPQGPSRRTALQAALGRCRLLFACMLPRLLGGNLRCAAMGLWGCGAVGL